MTIVAALLISFLASILGVYLFRRFASRSRLLMDIPNERSSHSKPVVRGAGLVIVLIVLLGYLTTAGNEAKLAYIFASAGVALISFIDDFRSIPLLPRLLVHVAAATAVVFWCGGYPGLSIPATNFNVDFGLPGVVITIIFIVWTTNAFNFMDGIDGIAGIQAVAAGVGWLLFGITSGQPAMATLGTLITGACLGFLLFNWQPASVFMGDVGSTFLGFTLASVPLIAAETSAPHRSEGFVLAAVFLWLFLFDTLFTRIRQIAKLRPFWRAHREHFYQRIVVSGTSHRAVSMFFGIFALVTAALSATQTFLGHIILALMIVAGPIALTLFARKKRLT